MENHANIIGNLDEKKYNVSKSSLKNKEDHVKHRSKSKLNWRWQPDILITTSDSDRWKKGAHEQINQGLKKWIFFFVFFSKIVVYTHLTTFYFFL